MKKLSKADERHVTQLCERHVGATSMRVHAPITNPARRRLVRTLLQARFFAVLESEVYLMGVSRWWLIKEGRTTRPRYLRAVFVRIESGVDELYKEETPNDHLTILASWAVVRRRDTRVVEVPVGSSMWPHMTPDLIDPQDYVYGYLKAHYKEREGAFRWSVESWKEVRKP